MKYNDIVKQGCLIVAALFCCQNVMETYHGAALPLPQKFQY